MKKDRPIKKKNDLFKETSCQLQITIKYNGIPTGDYCTNCPHLNLNVGMCRIFCLFPDWKIDDDDILIYSKCMPCQIHAKKEE